MSYGIALARKGFSLLYNNKHTKWSIEIGSMVPRHKRSKLSDYYIIVRNKDKIIDRVYVDDGNVIWVHGADDLPAYVREISENIITTGDINRFIIGDKKIENKFTQIGAARIH